MKRWEREFENIYLSYYKSGSNDITGLYLDLEKASKKYFESGELDERTLFVVPLTNGAKLNFYFYKDFTTLYMQDVSEENKETALINEDDGAAREYKQLKYVETVLQMTKSNIGEQYPDSLKWLLRGLKEGETISFIDGKTYVCLESGYRPVLLPAFEGKMKDFSLKSIGNKEPVTVNTDNDRSLQDFYVTNCKHLTERLEYNISHIDDARTTVQAIEKQILEEGTKTLCLGGIYINGLVSKSGNKVNWFDQDNRPVSREDIILLNGILQNNIYEREYQYDKNTDLYTEADEKNIEKKLEVLSVQKRYDKMYDCISTEVENNKGILSIGFELYTENSANEYVPASLSFIYKEGKARCYLTKYQGNSFKNDIEYICPVSQEEFVKFCRGLYDKNHEVLRTRIEDQIVKKYTQLKEK